MFFYCIILVEKQGETDMIQQAKSYLEDMRKMYEVIMKKCVSEGFLTDLDVMFLEIYKKTIEKESLA